MAAVLAFRRSSRSIRSGRSCRLPSRESLRIALIRPSIFRVDERMKSIDFIRSSTRKMDGLINAILKLSREGRRQLRPERIDLEDLLKANTAAIQHQLSEADG